MPQDLKRATVYLERAAKQGHVEARDELVTLFLEHQLVPQDNKVKNQVFERAAEQGCNVLATYELIASLLFGMNQQQIDWAEAQRILKHRIELDPILAGFKALLLHPDIFPDDRLEKSETKCLSTWAGSAIKLGLMAMIDSGNAWAQWLKGMFQEHVERDYDYAKKLYQLAANQGLALGQYSLGKLFYDDEQYHVAEDYYTRAANQGHAEAQYDLAMIYEPDFIAMKPRLEQAASQGHAEALYYLGTAYLDSDVVEQNCETAKEYFERAVGQGHANARYDLARPFSRLALLLLQ
jgi:TPR repeat protein